jgi:GAF domain-containing protein
MILNTARKLVNADRCSLLLHDKETGELWSKIALDSGEIRFPVTQGIAGHVFTTGEICSITDAYLDERFNSEFDKRNSYHTKTILCVPMLNSEGRLTIKLGEIIGVVEAVNKKPDGFIFNSSDIAQLTSFAFLGLDKLI